MKVQLYSTEESKSECRTNDQENERISIISSSGDEEVNLKLKADFHRNENIDIHQDLKSASPMSITGEELGYGYITSKNIKLVESNTTNMLLNRKIENQQNESNSTSDEVQHLQRENRILTKKLIEFEQLKKDEKFVMKEKLEILGKWVEDKNRRVKELLNIVQMLDDANVELMNKASEWQKSEKKLKEEIAKLKSSSSRDYPKTNIFVNYNSADWKEKIQHDLTAWESLKPGKPWKGNILSKGKKYERRSRSYRGRVKSRKFLKKTHKASNSLNNIHEIQHYAQDNKTYCRNKERLCSQHEE